MTPIVHALDTLASPSPAVAMMLRNAARAREGNEQSRHDPDPFAPKQEERNG